MGPSSRALIAAGILSTIVAASPAHAGLRIHEFLASNAEGLRDEDGESSDWIELFNDSSDTIALLGHRLTDDPSQARSWAFPAVDLGPGEFLLVFASGKSRATPGEELHANFSLDAKGEYLALLAPDGSTLDEFAPSFPPQRTDVSYGTAQAATRYTLVPEGAAVRVSTPGGVGPAWRDLAFDDSSWLEAATGLGFDRGATPAPPPDEQVNLALAGTASQSTEGFGGAPSRAIDGNRSGVFGAGSITHTATGDPNPWWQVELPEERPIGRIVLWNRTDCCASRLSNFRVLVRDRLGEETFEVDLYPDGDGFPSPSVELLLPPGTVGSLVRLESLGPSAGGERYLSLAEVEVFDAGGAGLRPWIETDLESLLFEVASGVLVRAPFEIGPEDSIDSASLSMRYDDGFVAWIDGIEVARRNAPATLNATSTASASRDDAEASREELIDLSTQLATLSPGPHVFTVHVLNASVSDEDLLLLPILTGLSVEGDRRRYLLDPSPGAINEGETVVGFVEDTTFEPDRGFYTSPFDLVITCATPGAEIRYTLDGSLPGADRGTVYSGPVRIETTTTLRAAAFLEGFAPTNVDTQTFLFAAHVPQQSGAGLPGSWAGTAADYELDPNVVNSPAYRDTIVADLQTIPSLSIVLPPEDLFGPRGLYSNTEGRGSAWERAASMELIYPEAWPGPRDGRGAQFDCGLRIFGFGWRSHSASLKHSFRLLFKSQYGAGKLRYPFFPDWATSTPGREDAYDNIVLRSQGSRGWNDFRESIEQTQYIRDAFARYTARDMGKLTTPSTYVHLYLNGLYWGLYNPVQRPDAKFLDDRFDPPESEYDALNARVGNVEVIDGDRADWNAALAIVRGNVTSLASWDAIRELVDVTDLSDYMLIQFYGVNRDWVGNNGNNMRAAGAPSIGGFRFFCWDMEYSIWNATDNVLNVRADQDTTSTIYARLLANDEFRLHFADRAHRHLTGSGALTPAATRARFLDRSREIDRAIVGESARWGDRRREPPYTRDVEWVRERDRLLTTYFPQRTEILLAQLRAANLYPRVEAPLFNREPGFVEPGALVSVSGVDGTVYFTADGTDPRQRGGTPHPDAMELGGGERILLIESGAVARALVPTDASQGLAWTSPSFDDAGWREGTTGVGFELASGYEALIGLDIGAESADVNGSVYVRIAFTVEDPAAITRLELDMKYDDGFVAYLDGVAVASANAPESPAWDALATGSHADNQAVQFERFDISSGIPRLRPGRNVLAIHGLNVRTTSNDFLILPELRASLAGEGAGALRVDASTRLMARARLDATWSALAEAVFWVDTPVRITEIQYHPAPDPEGSPFAPNDFEYVELANVGASTVSLDGLRLEGGVYFDFSTGAVPTLAPGEVVVVVENLEAFASRYGLDRALVAGEFTGRLEDAGEPLRLVGPLDAPLLDFAYDDDWVAETDGLGPSLVILDAEGERSTWADGASWRASGFPLGSPGWIESDGGGGLQLPGDATQDARLDLSDAVRLLGHLFLGDPAQLACDEAGSLELMDLNLDRRLNLSDAIHLLAYLFQGGPPPANGIECQPIVGCPDRCAQ